MTAPARRLPTWYPWYALVLLAVINILNYLDRNVIFTLFEPIKADLGLSDAQLGWLGSAYILVFSLAALPAGVLSDLRSAQEYAQARSAAGLPAGTGLIVQVTVGCQ